MRTVKIPKGNGRFRTVVVPSEYEKFACRKFLRGKDDFDWPQHVQGFVVGRNIVTNAKQHIGFRYTLSFDFEDFFDHVTLDHVLRSYRAGFIMAYTIRKFMNEGHFSQGLPTSPFFCNMGALFLDDQIMTCLQGINTQFAYTRYADDIAISFNNKADKGEIIQTVRRLSGEYGLPINENKIKFQGGRRIICGVGVDMVGVYPTRKAKRKLRAAVHQKHTASAGGLEEFIKLKEPNELHKSDRMLAYIRSNLTAQELSRICIIKNNRKSIALVSNVKRWTEHIYICNSIRSFRYWYNHIFSVQLQNSEFRIML